MATTLPPALSNQLDVLMIDNFDSFTWNLYQQLCLLGADVTVIRNDAISPSLFPHLRLNSLVISPGPGHPQTDSGISRAAIEYFQGKVPVLGVCMGLECLVDVYGGKISFAGEIMHGKCCSGNLAPELAITSKYTLEAVQYHPESILSEGGDDVIRNFLALRGGLQKEIAANPTVTAKIPSILDKIYTQPLTYALSGAHTISVLTEPKWFLGTLQDMLHARLSVANLPNRPAILRKDFILTRYQVLESRIWGQIQYCLFLELGMEPLVEVNNAKEMEIALSLPAKVIGVNNRNLHDFEVDMGTTSRLSDMVKNQDIVLCALSGISSAEDVQKYAAEGVGAVLIGESLMRAKDTAAFIRQLLSLPEPLSVEPQWRTAPPLVKICGIRSREEALATAEAGADMLGLMFVPTSKRSINLDTAREISEAIRSLRFAQPMIPCSDAITNVPWFNTHASRLSKAASAPALVGVFQNAPLETILHAVAYAQLDMVQLHGSEPINWAQQIPVPVIRVFHIGSGSGARNITYGGAHQFVLLDSMRDDGSGVSGGSGKVVDLDFAKRIVDAGEIITDAPLSPAVTAIPEEPAPEGTENEEEASPTVTPHVGNGSAKYGSAIVSPTSPIFPLPIILAGGLTPTNVSSAIEKVRPWAVDVSGGVEAEGGKSKDLDKVRAFIASVKGYAQ
ncbi:hypothetical protein BD779DRAFT_1512753 [Infundibulicybe gibba]|nr:hypothetical protein BD779DRAFT_1512753 [Infundibulicybe gibba]